MQRAPTVALVHTTTSCSPGVREQRGSESVSSCPVRVAETWLLGVTVFRYTRVGTIAVELIEGIVTVIRSIIQRCPQGGPATVAEAVPVASATAAAEVS